MLTREGSDAIERMQRRTFSVTVLMSLLLSLAFGTISAAYAYTHTSNPPDPGVNITFTINCHDNKSCPINSDNYDPLNFTQACAIYRAIHPSVDPMNISVSECSWHR
jgi:hypothetical protein